MSDRKQPLSEQLICGDWSRCTVDEIARETGKTEQTVRMALCRLRQQGIDIPYRRRLGGRPRKERRT